MQEYETRIKNRFGGVSLHVNSQHLTDFAAIRAAKKLCGEDQLIEVWRDDACVYSEQPQKPVLVWPRSKQARSR